MDARSRPSPRGAAAPPGRRQDRDAAAASAAGEPPVSPLAAVAGYLVGDELMRRAFEDVSIGSCIVGPDGSLIRVNEALAGLVGASVARLLGAPVSALVDPQAARVLAGDDASPAEGRTATCRLQARLRHRDGGPIPVRLAACLISGLDGARAYTIVQVQDLLAAPAPESRFAHLAMHDPLTDLPNRAVFLDRLQQALRRLSRRPGRVAVLFLDLDRFKQVNDAFGHGAGDRVLVQITARVRGVLRPGDTLARFGGDEFTVLCEEVPDEAAALVVGERVLAAVAGPLRLGGHVSSISASIGIAVTTDAGADAEALVHDADVAMFEAKDRGRNHVRLFDAAMRATSQARAHQVNSLRRAIREDELELHYQPVVRLEDAAVVGVEALVRWDHPELGILSPAAFVKLAEDTGQIMSLGSWVMRQACRDLSAWTPGFAPAELSVNLSAHQIGHPELLPSMRDLLERSGVEPSRVCLEITESVLVEDVETSQHVVRELKRLGVRIAIDDFGTGYSSLSYLRRLAVDVVKIDKSFVAGLGSDPVSEAIVAAVINLARAAGFTAVAEGVETEEQLVALRALRCERGQGFLWSRPLPVGALQRWQRTRLPAEVRAGSVDLLDLAAQRIDAVVQATRRRVLLRGPRDLPRAFADPAAVKVVVDHLLSNAVTFSAADRPVVVGLDADRRWVRIRVADFGVGMSPEAVARCFEQFWQAPPSGSAEPSGPRRSGMGLYVVRSLVEAMGGHVVVRSAAGKGSTFTVALPRTARSAARAYSRSGAALDVAENSSIQEFMRQIGVPMRRSS